MNDNTRNRIFYLVPVSAEVGLTSQALALVRALQLAGVRAGYVKPISQPELDVGEEDLSVHFARKVCGVDTPDSIPFDQAAESVRKGHLPSLMEDVVGRVEAARGASDVLIVEGLIPDADIQIATRLNIAMISSLSADIIPVSRGQGRGAENLIARMATAVEQYGDEGRRPIAGVLINFCDSVDARALAEAGSFELGEGTGPRAGARVDPEPAGAFGAARDRCRNAARLRHLQSGRHRDGPRGKGARRGQQLRQAARPLASGNPRGHLVRPIRRHRRRRAHRSARHAARWVRVDEWRPTDAGHGRDLRRPAAEPTAGAIDSDDTYTTATRLSGMSKHISADDLDRMERVIAFMADRLNVAPLVRRIDLPTDVLMPPPIFRHRLVASARAFPQRIVLPEGDEPRTLQAAAICAEKGIARCVLLGSPDRIKAVADAHGVELMPGVEDDRPRDDPPAVRFTDVEIRKPRG